MKKRLRGQRGNIASLMGVYLVVNAIEDGRILVDGPDCSLYKAHFIHGRHDLNSKLLNVDGKHRVCFTNVCAQSVTRDHNELILRRLRSIEEIGGGGVVLLTSLPGCSITGLDYEHLARSAGHAMRRDILAIPPTSLMGDWLDGYGVTLRALARHVDLSKAKPRKGSVAVVGYLMDRNEGDHRGNLKELERMLGALGLELTTVWLGGSPYEDLRKVKDAGLVISLPYARDAAAEIVKRTKAKLIETSLPFGLGATSRWLRRVAEAAGRAKRAESFIAAEERRVFERLEWLVPHLFLHKSVSFTGDPHMLEGFMGICGELGLERRECFVVGRESHSALRASEGEAPIVFEADHAHPVLERMMEAPPDLLVTSTGDNVQSTRWHDTAVVELGFPSYFHHALTDEPFLGYEGYLAFTGRIADALSAVKRTVLVRGPRSREFERITARERETERPKAAKRGG